MVMASLGICARAQINRFYYADLYPELYAAATWEYAQGHR